MGVCHVALTWKLLEGPSYEKVIAKSKESFSDYVDVVIKVMRPYLKKINGSH